VDELIKAAVFGLGLGVVFLIALLVMKKRKNALVYNRTGREKNLEKIEKIRGGS
jgi:hypothetical protein